MKEPLAFRMRPKKIIDVLGQEHLTGQGMLLNRCIEEKRMFSFVFYGPPGSGKTTLAMAISNELNLPYRLFNAVTSNKKDLTDLFAEAKMYPGLIIIIDEIHRLNKDKQDLLLPYVESGLVNIIGCTTSNPYFAINPAIRSRCHLLEIKALEKEDVVKAIKKALIDPNGLENKYTINDDALEVIAQHSNGDLRYAYNLLEVSALGSKDNNISKEIVLKYSSIVNTGLDSNQDGHYDAVSALQKSIRGSDVNAALYYLSRLIMANDMDSIERRLSICAYEDIGLANPNAVLRTVLAIETAKKTGFPEGMIPLGDAVIELALSPKSKSGHNAIHAAYDLATSTAYQVPKYLRLTPVGLNPDEMYDYAGYNKWHLIQYLPDEIKNIEFYKPNTNSQYEAALAKNYEELKKYIRTNDLKKLNKK